MRSHVRNLTNAQAFAMYPARGTASAKVRESNNSNNKLKRPLQATSSSATSITNSSKRRRLASPNSVPQHDDHQLESKQFQNEPQDVEGLFEYRPHNNDEQFEYLEDDPSPQGETKPMDAYSQLVASLNIDEDYDET